MGFTPENDGFQWQVGVWDRISQLYFGEIDPRFAPVIAGVIRHADLKPGDKVLDLGAGTGAVAIEAARGWSARPVGSPVWTESRICFGNYVVRPANPTLRPLIM